MSDLNGTKVPTLCNQFSIFIPWKAKLFYSLNRIMASLDKNDSKIFSFAIFSQICACFLGRLEHHIKTLRRPYLQSAVKNHDSLIVCAWHTMIVSLPVIVGLNGRYVIVLFSLYSICNILHLIVSSPLSTMTDKVSASHTTNISNPTTVVRVLLSMRTDEGGPEIWGTPHILILPYTASITEVAFAELWLIFPAWQVSILGRSSALPAVRNKVFTTWPPLLVSRYKLIWQLFIF